MNNNVSLASASLLKSRDVLLLFLLVLLSRISFLYAGYGVEEDSWGIALEAYHSHLQGKYIPSRFPGHPTHELVLTALWGYGPFVFNLLSSVFSAIGVVYFALILKHFQFKHSVIAALAFAFVPVYYISSTYTIDFVWTETLVLMSLYYLLKHKYILCGILLGLSVGCRITSGAMILPFIIIFLQRNNMKENIVRFVKITVPMIAVAVLCFLPIIKEFGLSFFMFYDQFPYPALSKVFYKMIIGVFGIVGVVAIITALLSIIIKRNKEQYGKLFHHPFDKKMIVAGIIIIVLYTISYLRLPQKSGYMIPVIPFIIVLFGYYLNSKAFKILCLAFIISPFICSINLTDKLRGAEHSKYAFVFTVSGQELFFDIFSGPIFSDYSKRKQKIKYTDEVIATAEKIKDKTVIISGWWYNEIMVTEIPKDKNKFVIFEPYINNKEINRYLALDYKIYYLPEQNIYNDEMFKMKLTDSISTPLPRIFSKENYTNEAE
jgi:hypothetical protein